MPPPKQGPIARGKAFIHETAAQPRPNLRTAPGSEGAKVERGAAVKPQDRSANFFRSAGQTALDNRRRSFQLHGLERVKREAEAFHRDNPHREATAVTYGQHLANLTKQGEVTPLFQAGGLRVPGVSHFVGATKEQRIGASYPKSDLVRAGENARLHAKALVGQATKDLTPTQKKLLVIAKEGHINLDDPQQARAHIAEMARQAGEGSHQGSLIPLVHRLLGSDVHKTLTGVLAEMDKKGAEHVITPAFREAVEHGPDERLVSGQDKVLNQTRELQDRTAARKYLPQVQTIEAEAQHRLDVAAKSGEHTPPGAASLVRSAQRLHEKLEAGFTARKAGEHTEADQHFSEAKNLADEMARATGRPTDRAYIKHQRIRGRENWLHTIGNRAPADPKKWLGILQKQGYRSTDPRLIEDSIYASIRNSLAVDHIAGFHNRFGVLDSDKLTAKQAQAEMVKKGLDPNHFQVANLGKIYHGMADRMTGGADLTHLDLNPNEHAKTMAELLDTARSVHGNDTTKGANIYPTTALHELRGALTSQNLASRLYGQGKGRYSSLMLGTSPAWATTMGLVTYPTQALMGGARPWDFPASVKWYHGLAEADKRRFDLETGTDNPFRSSHEGRAEKIGSATKIPGKHGGQLEDIIGTMKTFRESPFAKALHNNRPDRIVLSLERIPRRWARIAVATRHVKNAALTKTLQEAKGLQASQSKLENAMVRLQHVGRMPSAQYMDEVLKNVPLMEDVARKTQLMMGEWHKMTNFERNIGSKIPLFYPWIRYSVRLAAKTLPAHHPLMYGLAGQLGLMSREDLRWLLGTDTLTGKAPLGRAQPNLEPAEREWDWVGAPQADPLLNVVTEALSAKPSRMVGALPPMIAAPIEWMVNRNAFSDKPLRTSEPYKAGQHEENRPELWGTLANKVGIEPFAPGRALNDLTAKGRPQAADSLLGSKPMQYSPRTEAGIEEENEERAKLGAYNKAAKYAMPLLPHKEPGLLRAKLKEDEKKKRKEEEQESVSGW